ncbi:glycosyltransferase [Tropicibacter naphthalenivorans]|uniref:Cellulose synthase 1 n=1 Tax=Tropicibacter naphthalenivorans TaxID=441103 RepID=A0A0P1GL43_9RHOB|nr:glycosyltransferase [Tropicibacter naphthalenivorans]CUH76603.1 Cellulose synthase 1 [Tropicibacter naphthalenivorans]SMC64803.1 Glycosyltransferase, catalytic subunit of cellulose synthase and poly-beta-1,6-N-acetylglucosamine synthase [Tropicibacter naphthalenivorans]
MSSHRPTTANPALAQASSKRGQPISHLLIEQGIVAPRVMVGALAEAARIAQPVARVIEAEALASREEVIRAQSEHYGVMFLRREDTPPDPDVVGLLPPEFCLAHGVLPWMRLGQTVVLAMARPETFDDVVPLLPDDFGSMTMALALEADIHDEIADRHGAALARIAETSLPAEESCRDLNRTTGRTRKIAALGGLAGVALLGAAPQLFFAGALILALASLLIAQGMKLAALWASRRQDRPASVPLPQVPPAVSILVPLYKEENIARTLVRRLSRLSYPKSRLEVILVLEAMDDTTRETLSRTNLPPWMRVVTVPPGDVTTKPRALNYAFNFTRGDIIGIYDAEDAPAPDQIERVVAHFEHAPAQVGCVQGILDFYNPRANWLSRCFSIEYASWFRILLPGLAKMGFAVPLGGTTVFFRRDVLQRVRGWDAHNVTEDADLGIRLARHGYQTELVATVTREEANNRMWPWIKQRSRWLKGYAITWWVHSRRPIALFRDLGARRFLGVQMLFLTTLLQFTLAPILWSFWLILAGLPHPLDSYLDRTMMLWLTGIFLSAEGTSLLIGLSAVARTPHSTLFVWVPTLFAYFPLGTMAMYKALWETLTNPFYWDKTQHGHSAPDTPHADLPPDFKG